jgi:succinyl-diaminopimelate desuccinylase
MTPSAYLHTHVADLTGLLRKLVQIPSVNPPGERYEEITALLVRELEMTGLRVRRYAIPKRLQREVLAREQCSYPRFNVLGRWPVRGAKKTIHFNAHYDVVPVSGKWRHGSPFSGSEEGGWIYGRGTADMKGAMASLILALRALRVCGVSPRMNVEVSFTADEETDSALGAGWLVREAPVKPDYAVVMEGGEGARVCCGHNGVVWLNVVVLGRAAHGSRPLEGINALEKMSALVLALEFYKKKLCARSFATPDGKVMHPTVNVGGVFAAGEGGKINTVPARASFSVDRRVLPNETVADAERELREFLRNAAGGIADCRIAIEKVSENHPCFTAPEGPFFDAMAGSVAGVRREPTAFSVSSGFNDMHFFSHHLHIPTLGYGPGGEQCHAVDERARIRELVRAAAIYARLLVTFDGLA